MNKRNAMLEALRGLACLLVVFCHFHIENSFGTYVIALARFAVPFFLLISGYFALRPTTEESISFARKKLLSTGRLLVVGTAVCIVSNTVQCMLKGEAPFKWFMDVIGPKAILKLLIFNRAHWLSSVMYYLFMVVYVYIAYMLICKFNLLKISYYFVPLFLVLNVFISKTDYEWYYAGNFIFTGIPFFLLGCWIKGKDIKFSSTWKNILAVAIGIIFTFVENFFYSECYCYIGTIILSLSTFLLGLRCCDLKIPGVISGFGTKFSMLIFLLHCPIGHLLVTALEQQGILLGNFEPFVVIAATILVCIPIVLLRDRLENDRVDAVIIPGGEYGNRI